MVFTVFDRDALISALEANKGTFQRIGADRNMSSEYAIEDWDQQMKALISNSTNNGTNTSGGRSITTAENITRAVVGDNDNSKNNVTHFYYADELPPFDGARYAA